MKRAILILVALGGSAPCYAKEKNGTDSFMRKVLKKLHLTTDEKLANAEVVDSRIEAPPAEQRPPRGPSFLYQTDLGLFTRGKVIRGHVNKACGAYYKSRPSRIHIRKFVRDYKINTAEIEKPLSSYATFNDFFIRKLKPGSRPIDPNPTTITSLADSKLTAIENIALTKNFMIKGTKFTLRDFLNDAKLAEDYEQGTLLIFRLAPEDYHRFHFPCDCVPSAPKVIHGNYDSVNPVVYKAGIQPLTTNERQLIKLETDRFSTVIMVPVGALCVGKIVETYTPNQPYKKGDEAGYFEFGGSTVALLFKKDMVRLNPYFVQQAEAGKEVPVRVGQVVAFELATFEPEAHG